MKSGVCGSMSSYVVSFEVTFVICVAKEIYRSVGYCEIGTAQIEPS